jgi:hypothetical protein
MFIRSSAVSVADVRASGEDVPHALAQTDFSNPNSHKTSPG